MTLKNNFKHKLNDLKVIELSSACSYSISNEFKSINSTEMPLNLDLKKARWPAVQWQILSAQTVQSCNVKSIKSFN